MNTYWFDLEQKEIQIQEDSKYVCLFIGKNHDQIQSSIRFIHKRPNITSNILIKVILFDSSQADILGDLVIRKGAKNTDSYLKIDVLIMSEKATARAVPSLEITEDSVKGGHGATVGPVDEEQLFYLQSRGINRESAEKIIAEGFIADVLQLFGNNLPTALKEQVAKLDN